MRLLLLVTVTLSACSTLAPVANPTQTATRVPSPSPSPTRSPVPEAHIVASLNASGLRVAEITVYTAQTDPNSLLGRPGQYVGKISWRDQRAPQQQVTIEIFADEPSLTARFNYLDAIIKSSPLFVQYMYVNSERRAILRVPKELTPENAAQYESWLRTL